MLKLVNIMLMDYEITDLIYIFGPTYNINSFVGFVRYIKIKKNSSVFCVYLA